MKENLNNTNNSWNHILTLTPLNHENTIIRMCHWSFEGIFVVRTVATHLRKFWLVTGGSVPNMCSARVCRTRVVSTCLYPQVSVNRWLYMASRGFNKYLALKIIVFPCVYRHLQVNYQFETFMHVIIWLYWTDSDFHYLYRLLCIIYWSE